ncbi:hypothetical protein MUP01_11235 [Candidatus Bathyarchaeota archaeon]|nr:hypothetical protein [Candidatus Bathyarchaeota archaeon]
MKPSDKAILLECITDMRSDRNVISLPRSAWVKIIEKTGGKIETAEKLDYSRKDEKAGILSSALRRKKQLM